VHYRLLKYAEPDRDDGNVCWDNIKDTNVLSLYPTDAHAPSNDGSLMSPANTGGYVIILLNAMTDDKNAHLCGNRLWTMLKWR